MLDESALKQLVDRFLAGDGALFPRIFSHFRPRLHEMVSLRMGGQLAARIDPSDVIQDAFLDATRKVKRYTDNPDVSIFVWLRGVTRDRLSKLQREHLGAECRAAGREVALPADASAVFATQLVQRSTPSGHLLQVEMHECVQKAIGALNEADRDVILMRHFEGLTNNQVAEALRLTASGATMRHGRALARLKSLLETELDLSGDEE